MDVTTSKSGEGQVGKKSLLLIVKACFIMILMSGFTGVGIVDGPVKSAYADSNVLSSYFAPDETTALSEIDREINRVQENIDSVNLDLLQITNEFYENYIQAEAVVQEGFIDAPAVLSGDAIGVVIAVRGNVTARKGQGYRNLRKGDSVYEKDTIISAANSNVEIRFKDDAIFSQGAESKMVLDEYLFDPADASGSGISVNLMQGAFRHVTGRIAEQNPEGVRFESKLAWIGIRGTTTVHVVAPRESHGVEDVDPGSNVMVGDSFDRVEMISESMIMVDVYPDRPMGPQRAMTDFERDFFHSIAPTAVQAQAPQRAAARIQDIHQSITSLNEVQERSISMMGRLEKSRDQAMGQAMGCFPGNVRVLMEDGETRMISRIRPGDMVITYDIGYDVLKARPVVEVYTFDADHLYTINGHLTTTGGERLMTDTGWKRVSRLKEGEMVMMDRRFVELESIEHDPADLLVYNLQVADTHNFFVSSSDSGSYLVHNYRCDCNGGYGRSEGK